VALVLLHAQRKAAGSVIPWSHRKTQGNGFRLLLHGEGPIRPCHGDFILDSAEKNAQSISILCFTSAQRRPRPPGAIPEKSQIDTINEM
jgi:hypothetical protein